MSRRCPQCGTEYPDEIAFCGEDGTITIQVAPPSQQADPRLGSRFGEYVVVARVADGAMGRVYEGRHLESKQRVAIKILHDDVARDRIAVERFKREFETAQSLESRWVVRVIDFGEVPAKPNVSGASWYMTMEYLEGRELGGILRESGALETARALRILCQVALGLDDAHREGVIHRDLKPDNLFLCRTPTGDAVRILDFGSVKLQMETGPKLTAFGTTLGSPYYMSPEQAMGKSDVDQRTDVFALAAILYEMLSGKIAFDGQMVAQILMKIVNEMPDPIAMVKPGLPPSLGDVIERGLAKDKTARHGSAVDLAAATLTAFGLPVSPGREGVERIATSDLAAVEALLQNAKPPAAAAYGAPASSSAAPVVSASHSAASHGNAYAPRMENPSAPAFEASSGASSDTWAGPRLVRGPSVPVLVAIALTAFVLVGTCGVSALLFLR